MAEVLLSNVFLADESATLLLYSLVHGNADFLEYVLVRTDIDTLSNCGGVVGHHILGDLVGSGGVGILANAKELIVRDGNGNLYASVCKGKEHCHVSVIEANVAERYHLGWMWHVGEVCSNADAHKYICKIKELQSQTDARE